VPIQNIFLVFGTICLA